MKPTDLVQGTLDLLILRTLALEAMHGELEIPCFMVRIRSSGPEDAAPGALVVASGPRVAALVGAGRRADDQARPAGP